MDFELKYEFEKTINKRDFHRTRVMFAIINGEIFIADPFIADSHAEWFKKMNWISENNDSAMNNDIRGFVDKRGLFFYTGYDFHTTSELEEYFLTYLRDSVKKLKLSDNTHIFAGCVIGPENPFPPRKNLGTIKELIK